MYPYINISGLEIQTYSILATIGFILTAVVALKLSKNRNISLDKSLMAIIVSALGLFLGGHLLFAVTNIKEIVGLVTSGEFSISAIIPYVSGMVFYGGLFGATIAASIYVKSNKEEISQKDILDVFAVSVPLFHAFGRVGCFFSGCCYGVESDFGITTYLNTAPLHYGISRFPVALVEAFANIIIFALLFILFKNKKCYGNLFIIYLSLYAPIRFVLEFFRGDEIRGFVFGFSTSQLISLLIIVSLIIYIVLKLIRKKF